MRLSSKGEKFRPKSAGHCSFMLHGAPEGQKRSGAGRAGGAQLVERESSVHQDTTSGRRAGTASCSR